METALTVTEQTRLTELETVIERGLTTFVDVGLALLEIRDSRLYRLSHSTFEGYCQQRWGIARRTAYQLMDAAEVVENVRNCAQIPTNEAQARPLSSLSPEKQIEAWQQVLETAPQGRITAAHVQAIVDRMEPEVRLSQTSQAVQVTVFSHESVEYYTPQEYIEAAREVLGEIDLDPASCEAAQEWIQARIYYTKEQDGLFLPWSGRVWLNPPYSKTGGESNQALWSQRLQAEYMAGNVAEAVLLVKAALGYKWFDELWYKWPVCFARERISFVREDGSDEGQSKQGTAFLYFGRRESAFRQVFSRIGRVILPEEGCYVGTV